MKSKKTENTKTEPKPAVPAKMKSALTNLNHIIQPAPQAVISAAVAKSEPKSIPARPLPVTTPPAPPAPKAPAPIRSETITVEARIDVGYGNGLFIRGQGAGLSWDKGTPLACRDGSNWLWSAANGHEPVEFKLLLNDQQWANGDNLVVAPGEKVEVVPDF